MIHPAARNLLIEAAKAATELLAKRERVADIAQKLGAVPVAGIGLSEHPALINAYEQWRAAGRPHLTDEESIQAGVPLERRQAFTGPGFVAWESCDDGRGELGRNTCPNKPVWRCWCDKCTRLADSGGQFHVCSEHLNKAKLKHESVYPRYSPDFRHVEETR